MSGGPSPERKTAMDVPSVDRTRSVGGDRSSAKRSRWRAPSGPVAALLALAGMDGAASEAPATTPPAPVGRAPRTRLTAIATIGAPVAVGLAPLVWLWAANRSEFEPGVMVVPAIVVTGLALLLVAVFQLLTGRLGAASLLASATLVAIFAFGTELDVLAAVLGREPGRSALLVRAVNLVALGARHRRGDHRQPARSRRRPTSRAWSGCGR